MDDELKDIPGNTTMGQFITAVVTFEGKQYFLIEIEAAVGKGKKIVISLATARGLIKQAQETVDDYDRKQAN